MDWSSESLYNKSKLFAERAHNEPVDSALFGFWMSLAVEMLGRAALAYVHPALLADPKETRPHSVCLRNQPEGRSQVNTRENRVRALLSLHRRFHRQNGRALSDRGGPSKRR